MPGAAPGGRIRLDLATGIRLAQVHDHASGGPRTAGPRPSGLGRRQSGPPTLTDGVVLLRPLREDDVDPIVRGLPGLGDGPVDHGPGPLPPVGRAGLRARTGSAGWRSGTNPTWAVADPGNDAYWGGIDLRLDGEAGAEVGYAVAPWARGRGVAGRALALACRWGFEVAGLEMVLWLAFAGNERSRRTARRVGFHVLDGVVRKGVTQRGRRRDTWVGDLLPEDLVLPR